MASLRQGKPYEAYAILSSVARSKSTGGQKWFGHKIFNSPINARVGSEAKRTSGSTSQGTGSRVALVVQLNECSWALDNIDIVLLCYPVAWYTQEVLTSLISCDQEIAT